MDSRSGQKGHGVFSIDTDGRLILTVQLKGGGKTLLQNVDRVGGFFGGGNIEGPAFIVGIVAVAGRSLLTDQAVQRLEFVFCLGWVWWLHFDLFV